MEAPPMYDDVFDQKKASEGGPATTEDARETAATLIGMGATPGFASFVVQENKLCAKRFYLLDNSGEELEPHSRC